MRNDIYDPSGSDKHDRNKLVFSWSCEWTDVRPGLVIDSPSYGFGFDFDSAGSRNFVFGIQVGEKSLSEFLADFVWFLPWLFPFCVWCLHTQSTKTGYWGGTRSSSSGLSELSGRATSQCQSCSWRRAASSDWFGPPTCSWIGVWAYVKLLNIFSQVFFFYFSSLQQDERWDQNASETALARLGRSFCFSNVWEFYHFEG